MIDNVQKLLHQNWIAVIATTLAHGTPKEDGTIVLDVEVVEYLKRLSTTTYEELSENDKEFYASQYAQLVDVISTRFPNLRFYLEHPNSPTITSLVDIIHKMSDNTPLKDLREIKIWEHAQGQYVKYDKGNFTGVINALIRSDYTTVGQVRAMVRKGVPLRTYRNISEVRIKLMNQLFG